MTFTVRFDTLLWILVLSSLSHARNLSFTPSKSLTSGDPHSFPLERSCPFSRWGGEPRYCYECRWCPFRRTSCCEMEDEIDVLKTVNASGSVDWDCFITIAHFQQCGRCDPNSNLYAVRRSPKFRYASGPFGFTIQPCLQACTYIFNRCRGVRTLGGDLIVGEMTLEEFCQDACVKHQGQTLLQLFFASVLAHRSAALLSGSTAGRVKNWVTVLSHSQIFPLHSFSPSLSERAS